MTKKAANIDYNDCVIDIKDVRKSFGDLDVLKGVNLQLFNGENLVVLGRSGTGKSVLIKLISKEEFSYKVFILKIMFYNTD